ncbi:unnamed protein product [Sphagnum jensenii]
MTAVPLGKGAYKRLYAGAPEVRLLNRWLEANPSNLREGSSVLARPGTTPQLTFNAGSYSLSSMRGTYALSGIFNDSLFVVCGETLYRINKDMSVTTITGIINGTGYPQVAWQKGAGYERLWVIDGLLVQYYSGTSHATATLTKAGTIVNGTDKFQVGSVYYTWGTTFSSSDTGSSTHPFVVNPTTTSSVLDPMNQLILAVNASGTPGTDYSPTILIPNTLVSASTPDTTVPATHVLFTASASGTGGNSISTTVVGGAALSFSSTTLINGGIDALEGCSLPYGLTPVSITQVSSYVLVAIGNTQQFYWVNPGETSIDPLNFASKESSPDNIIALAAVGDSIVVIGTKSFENWYATGNSLTPFSPIEGRVYARGVIDGTYCVVDDGIFLVGDDGRVYTIGFQYGDTTDLGWGVTRVSDNGIEERIRRQIRREAGLNP